MLSRRCPWRVRRSVRLAAPLCLAALAGCIQPADIRRDELASARALPLPPGTRIVQAAAGEQLVYQVSAPAGSSVQVEASSGTGGAVELIYVEAPDGQNFISFDNKSVASHSGLFQVAAMPGENGGAGFRFSGSAARAGAWRFGILGTPRAAQDTFSRFARQRSLLEQSVLVLYLLTGPHRNANDPLDLIAALGRVVYADIHEIDAPVDIRLKVTIGPPGSDDSSQDPPGNANGNDNAGGNRNDNTDDGTGNVNDNAGGNTNGNANDNTGGNSNTNSNDNSGGNDNSNTNGNANDNDNPPPPPPPPARVTLQRIVSTGDPVPGQSASARFVRFGNPLIDASGRVAFWANYAGGQGDGGLYVWDNGVVRRVVDDNPQTAGSVPGRNASAFFGNFNVAWDAGSHPLAWGSNGRLIFVSPIQGGQNSRGVYRWRASDGDILRVADMEQIAALYPDVLNGAFAGEFSGPGLTDNGIVTFNMRYTYIRVDRQFVAGKRGIYTSDANTISVLADHRLSEAGDVPEQGPTVMFDEFDPRTTLNPRGDILFQATYLNGLGGRGIFRARDSVLSGVVDNAENRNFPGLAGTRVLVGGAFADAVAIGGNGDIALDLRIRPGGGDARDAVLLWNGQLWRDLAAGGASATALLTGVNDAGQAVYLAGDRPRLADAAGDVDLAAVLPAELGLSNVTWESSGGALSNAGRALLRFTRPAVGGGPARPGLMLWSGERLLVVFDPASDLTHSAIDVIFTGSTPETNRPGRSGALNDADQLVFRVGDRGADGNEGTADDVQSIFLGRGE